MFRHRKTKTSAQFGRFTRFLAAICLAATVAANAHATSGLEDHIIDLPTHAATDVLWAGRGVISFPGFDDHDGARQLTGVYITFEQQWIYQHEIENLTAEDQDAELVIHKMLKVWSPWCPMFGSADSSIPFEIPLDAEEVLMTGGTVSSYTSGGLPAQVHAMFASADTISLSYAVKRGVTVSNGHQVSISMVGDNSLRTKMRVRYAYDEPG